MTEDFDVLSSDATRRTFSHDREEQAGREIEAGIQVGRRPIIGDSRSTVDRTNEANDGAHVPAELLRRDCHGQVVLAPGHIKRGPRKGPPAWARAAVATAAEAFALDGCVRCRSHPRCSVGFLGRCSTFIQRL